MPDPLKWPLAFLRHGGANAHGEARKHLQFENQHRSVL